MPIIVDKDAKKREIALAALPIFAEKGVAKTTVIEIAEAAGVGKGTIYEYFANKDAILQYCMVFIFGDFEVVMEEVMTSGGTASEKLILMFEGVAESLSKDPTLVMLVMELWGTSLNKHLKDHEDNMAAMYEDFHIVIADIIESGVVAGEFKPVANPVAIASGMLAVVDGVILQQVVVPDKVDMKAFILESINVMINGLKRG